MCKTYIIQKNGTNTYNKGTVSHIDIQSCLKLYTSDTLPPYLTYNGRYWRTFIKKIYIYTPQWLLVCSQSSNIKWHLVSKHLYCKIRYFSHFLSYNSILSLLTAYISSDSLSISSSVSKCLTENGPP